MTSGRTRAEGWRRVQLGQLRALLEKHEEDVLLALNCDLGKPATEAMFEIIALRQELKLAENNLNKWMRPRKIQVPLSLKPGEARIQLEPVGCVLIIGPWNYPFSLTLQPLISALAAGNTAVIKPSENAPATSNLLSKLIRKYFSSEVVTVIEGDASAAKSLVDLPFDHIFFTGGSAIGKKVMSSAANHLTPITLELGGKSPAIVLEDANLEVTAKRLMWGKGLNAGQTCIAPDHLLVQEKIKAPLINFFKNVLNDFYGLNPLKSKDLAKIVNEYHFNRLNEIVRSARSKGNILLGGRIDSESRRIEPTIIEITEDNDIAMNDEIFGPILPIITVPSLGKAIERIIQLDRPLALYMFGGTIAQQREVLRKTSSGTVCFNDVIMQAGVPELPFGGIGASGMGRYHGISGFETFSNQRSILQRPFWLDLKLRYPPYRLSLPFIKKMLS